MLRIIYQEFKRFYLYIFLVIILYLILILPYGINNYSSIMLEINLIQLLTMGMNIFLITRYIIDEFSKYRLLFLKAKQNQFQLLLSKLIVIFAFTIIAFVISLILFNIRLSQFKNQNELAYMRMNLDYQGFILIDKTFKEKFYIINYLLNIFYNDIIIFSIVAYFKYLKHQFHFLFALLFSILSINLTNYLVYWVVEKMNMDRTFNLNYLNERVVAMQLQRGEINFLSIASIIVYTIVITIHVLNICGVKERKYL